MNTQNTNSNQSAIYNIIKKSISKNEIIWVKYMIHNSNPNSNSDIIKYIITSDKNRTVYFLYEYSIKDNKYIKTNHQSNDPTKLEQKYIKLEFEPKPNPRPKSDSKSKPKPDSKPIPKSKSKSKSNSKLNSDSNSDLPINTNTAINNGINTNTSTNTGTRKRGRPKKEKESQIQNQGQNKIQKKGKLF